MKIFYKDQKPINLDSVFYIENHQELNNRKQQEIDSFLRKESETTILKERLNILISKYNTMRLNLKPTCISESSYDSRYLFSIVYGYETEIFGNSPSSDRPISIRTEIRTLLHSLGNFSRRLSFGEVGMIKNISKEDRELLIQKLLFLDDAVQLLLEYKHLNERCLNHDPRVYNSIYFYNEMKQTIAVWKLDSEEDTMEIYNKLVDKLKSTICKI